MKGEMMHVDDLEMTISTVREFMEMTDLWAAHVDRVEKIGRISEVFKNTPNDPMQIRYDIGLANTEDWKSEHVPLANVCVDIESAERRMMELQEEARRKVNSLIIKNRPNKEDAAKESSKGNPMGVYID
jgi:hypothetical protein